MEAPTPKSMLGSVSTLCNGCVEIQSKCLCCLPFSPFPFSAFLSLNVLFHKRVVARDEVEERRILVHGDLAELLDDVRYFALELREIDSWAGIREWGRKG